ncbi:MAG: diphosphate--fructose-6-phosphate 1-phosphotransferase [Verrucomicrobia bacterium]|nr:diphosphate--fructose-6-phosphate 1-phosphotransferase [Verrucomicrobiota bacterium]
MTRSPLQKVREQYQPPLPEILFDVSTVHLTPIGKDPAVHEDEKVKTQFPHIFGQPLLMAKPGRPKDSQVLRVGVVFSGGQAAGGHNVITGLFDALKKLHPQSRLFGFLGGPGGIVSGSYQELELDMIKPYRNQGGFDLIGSGRTKIETPEQLSASLEAMQKLQLDGLVIIGGDDSNTNAAVLAEYFAANGCKTKVVGVPKTIDGDLKNEHVAISFGFDTACKVYSEIIGNIARDALSAKKYYHFIRLMGRSASHIALECALATHPTYAIIGEEVFSVKKTLKQITEELADLICARAALGKHFGVILVPEGLIEFIPEVGILIQELNAILAKQENCDIATVLKNLTPPSQKCFSSLPELIQKQLLLSRDPHGNVQVSFIETERLLMEMVSSELSSRRKEGSYQGKFNAVQHFLGYEGRSGFPSNFDCNYCYSLGFSAALLIDSGHSGYMCFVKDLARPVSQWQMGGVPLTSLMNFEMRKGQLKPVIKKALVDLKGKSFHVFSENRKKWGVDDPYCFPGPIQFFGDTALTDSRPFILTDLN